MKNGSPHKLNQPSPKVLKRRDQFQFPVKGGYKNLTTFPKRNPLLRGKIKGPNKKESF